MNQLIAIERIITEVTGKNKFIQKLSKSSLGSKSFNIYNYSCSTSIDRTPRRRSSTSNYLVLMS